MEYISASHTLAQLLGLIIHENPESAVVKGIEGVIASDRHILEVTKEELLSVKGIGQRRAESILAALQLNRICCQPVIQGKIIQISSPGDVASFLMAAMRFLDREHFKVIMLTTKNEVIGLETVAIGNLNSAIVHPREVLKAPIKKSAASVILAHNHPSGNPNPSQEDIELTKRLIAAGQIIGIEVLDHIIIGNGSFTSLKEKCFI